MNKMHGYAKDHPNYQPCGEFLSFVLDGVLTAPGIQAMSAIAVAVFTAFLYDSTRKLWQATMSAANRQESDTRIIQRAYIAVEPKGIRLLVEGKSLIGHVGMRNAGNLPAGNLAWFVNLKSSGNSKETDFPLDEPRGSIVVAPKVVAPRGSGSSLYIIDLDNLADAKPAAARDQENPLFLYVWGVVRYDDGFRNIRETTFCHRYNWKSRGLGKVEPHEIHEDFARYHEHGNGAT